jgi:hypothetical protein
MDPTTAAIKDLARRLIAFEAMRDPPDGSFAAAVRACETLRGPLTRFVGVTGFGSLLSRALAMARADIPCLDAVRVRPDGSLEGWEGVGPRRDSDRDAGAVVVAQLLGLLVTFIGEPLTLRLVRDAWPDLDEAGSDRVGEGPS